jgi:hypothetical protein
MSSTLEKILEEVKALSPGEKTQLREILAGEPPPAKDVAFIRQVRGKYKHALSSTEDFMARKQEEIEIEEQRFRSR